MPTSRRATFPEEPLNPVLDFMRLLWRIEHGLQATSKRMETRLGVTGPQRLALRIVGTFPGISAGDLARILHLHPSTMTGIIQRLVEKRLLLRERDPDDGRRMHLHLRTSGPNLERLTPGTVEEAVARALKSAPTFRVRQARLLLNAVAEALDGDTH